MKGWSLRTGSENSMDNSRLMRGRGPIFTLKIFAGEETGLIPSLDVFWSLTSICIPLTKAHEREDSKGTLPLVTDSISLQMQKQRFEVCLDCCAAPLPFPLRVGCERVWSSHLGDGTGGCSGSCLASLDAVRCRQNWLNFTLAPAAGLDCAGLDRMLWLENVKAGACSAWPTACTALRAPEPARPQASHSAGPQRHSAPCLEQQHGVLEMRVSFVLIQYLVWCQPGTSIGWSRPWAGHRSSPCPNSHMWKWCRWVWKVLWLSVKEVARALGGSITE